MEQLCQICAPHGHSWGQACVRRVSTSGHQACGAMGQNPHPHDTLLLLALQSPSEGHGGLSMASSTPPKAFWGLQKAVINQFSNKNQKWCFKCPLEPWEGFWRATGFNTWLHVQPVSGGQQSTQAVAFCGPGGTWVRISMAAQDN